MGLPWLANQWLRLGASNAGGVSSIPGWRTMPIIPHDTGAQSKSGVKFILCDLYINKNIVA